MALKNINWIKNNQVNVLRILANTVCQSPVQIPLDQPEVLIKVEKDTFCILYFVLRDNSYNTKITVELNGENGEIELLGAFYGVNLNFDITTKIIHKKRNTKSKTIIRGVLEQSSSSVYSGLIRVEKSASDVWASLEYAALLLSDSAKAKPIPSLEILNNEVQVSHAVTVGRINDEDLFYLKTRGLDEHTAKETITKGFLNKIDTRIGLKSVSSI